VYMIMATARAYKDDVFRTLERTTIIVLPDTDWLLWSSYGWEIISLVIYLSDRTRAEFLCCRFSEECCIFVFNGSAM